MADPSNGWLNFSKNIFLFIFIATTVISLERCECILQTCCIIKVFFNTSDKPTYWKIYLNEK